MLACYRSGRQAEALEAYRRRAARCASSAWSPGPDCAPARRILAATRRWPGPTRRGAQHAARPGDGAAAGLACPGRAAPAAAVHRPVGALAELDRLPRHPGVRARHGGDLGDRRHRRGGQDRPGRALGAPGRRPVPRRAAVRQPARLRPGRRGRWTRPRRSAGSWTRSGSRRSGSRPSLDAQAALYRSLLAGRRMLIVLDNARDAEQVRPLLPGAPGCLVLVTSRNQLTGLVAADGAHPLTARPAHRRRGPRAAGPPARRRTGWPPSRTRSPRSSPAARRLPLALAIVAARAATQPRPAAGRPGRANCATAAAGWTRSTGDDPATDVRAVFSWSYRALSARPRPGCSGCSACTRARHHRRRRGQPGRPPAGAGAGRCWPSWPAPTCSPSTPPAGTRFHDLLRAYAAEQARSHDTEPAGAPPSHRMLDHYLHTAYAADRLLEPAPRARSPSPPPQPGRHRRSTGRPPAGAWPGSPPSTRSLLAAVDHAAATGFDTHAWQLAWTLRTLPRPARALARLGRHASAPRWPPPARLADPAGQASAHRVLGRSPTSGWAATTTPTPTCGTPSTCTPSRRPGRPGPHPPQPRAPAAGGRASSPEALDHAQQALDLFRAAGHRAGQASALNAVGWYHAQLGDHHAGPRPAASRRSACTRSSATGHGQADTWDSLGYAHHHLGHHAEAIACYRHALTCSATWATATSRPGRCGAWARPSGPAAVTPRPASHSSRRLPYLDQLGHPDAGNGPGQPRGAGRGWTSLNGPVRGRKVRNGQAVAALLHEDIHPVHRLN